MSVRLGLIGSLIVTVLMVPGVASAAAPEVTSGQLVEEAQKWDGQRVSFTGEAVGSAMDRGEFTWLHLNDDVYGMAQGVQPVRLQGYNSGQAVLVPSELAARVSRFGSYRERGDLVTIEGTFYAADPRFGGDMLIEAESLSIERSGEALVDDPQSWKFVVLVTLAVGAGLSYAALIAKRRSAATGRSAR